MVAARLLDVLLILLLLVYLGEGWRNGFARSLSAIVGIVVGGIVAFFAIPLIAAAIPLPFWRTVVVIAVVLGLLIGGHAAGAVIGNAIRGRSARERPAVVDRVFGALVNVVASVLVVTLIVGSVGQLGVPVLSAAISSSAVLNFVNRVMPEPLEAALARVRSTILEQGLPSIAEALGGVTSSPGVPDVDTGTGVLGVAAQSVVRISGTAYACGQNQSGSGFVVAADRIVTNAHVVAGVNEPVVEAPNGQTLDGRVVYFDPDIDIAVIAVDGLTAPPLALSPDLEVGDDAVVDGYPFGGPFTTGAAQVLAVSNENIDDIYASARHVREVYTLAATVNPGNSGGPLLATDGTIAGIVFARSATDADLGYAMTNTELQPVASAAAALATPITAGTCVRG
ncbi:MarP family serine protease [soil metagenome]